MQHPKIAKDLFSAIDINGFPEDDSHFYLQYLKLFSEKIAPAEDRVKTSLLKVFSKLSSQSSKGLDELSELMNDWSLVQITNLMYVLKTRLGIIELLESAIHNEKTYELKGDNSIHAIMEQSMWLIDEKYWIARSNKSMKDFIIDKCTKAIKKKSRLRPDFACTTFDNKLLLVEIKKPSISLSKKELDQIEQYVIIADEFKGQDYA